MEHPTKAFTLIELLVVVAIIGILASVVLASLNSAREKGKIAAIRSNLRNAVVEAEFSYDDNENYSQVCTDIQDMLDSITNTGATSSCYTHTATEDVYQRWGASGLVDTTIPIKAYSSSQNGTVTWDEQGVNPSGAFVSPDITMDWDTANTACSLSGGRLPTLEELKSLSDASYTASGDTSYTAPGFVTNYYWSSVTVPSTPENAYLFRMSSGNIFDNTPKTYDNAFIRCVR